jgi:hypothetical protein
VALKKALILGGALALVLLGMPENVFSAEDVPLMTKEQLKAMLGDKDLIILDVRTNEQWNHSDLKILGAIHEDPEKVEGWVEKYPKDKTLVFYCA